MKRYSGLHDKLCTIENIEVADDNARKNKNKKYGINKHDKNRQYENEDLVDKLFNLKYKTSKYSLYKIYEPKERIIYRLPYYPDRIAHHAIMNVVKYIWTKSFIHNTYSCIEGRGIHLCANNLKRDLRKYPNETKYCLKLDIRKFYPSIPHNGLKKCIRNGKAYYADSRDKTLFYSIHRLNHFPINFKITKYDWRIYTKNRKENIKPQI